MNYGVEGGGGLVGGGRGLVCGVEGLGVGLGEGLKLSL